MCEGFEGGGVCEGGRARSWCNGRGGSGILGEAFGDALLRDVGQRLDEVGLHLLGGVGGALVAVVVVRQTDREKSV